MATDQILVIDVGGTHVKLLATGRSQPVKIPSGPKMTPKAMVSAVRKATAGWKYSAVSIGYPGPVMHGRPVSEPANLGRGWVGFDFKKAFGHPVKVRNDAALQALGSYKGGRMLFLGLGTGLGSALIADGILEPMELAHLPYKKKTYEDYVGLRGLKRFGKKRWRAEVTEVVRELKKATEADYVVLGGGNAKLIKKLPPGARRGDNTNTFRGGFRLWQTAKGSAARLGSRTVARPVSRKPPPLNADIQLLPSSEALYRAAAAEFVKAADEAVRAKGLFTVALSGGSTPAGMYSLLASDPAFRDQVQWGKAYFFWGDERLVPPDHKDSNYRMAHETLLSKVGVPTDHVFRIKAEHENAGAAADEYEKTLRDFFKLKKGQFPRFDLVLLGMGMEGHTASLFPGTGALHEENRLVVSTWIGKLLTDRITLTPPVLNNAARVVFLIQGEEKAPALKAVLEGPYEPDQLPAQLIRPRRGKLLWLIEQSAGRLLNVSTQPKTE
ncbi:MAG: 6-phosphogluconolactonase [Terriglobia bacterium]|jgi:6-phosphogluconolactonase